MNEIDWTENCNYVILNNGQPIHRDLVGRFVVDSKASRAFRDGYKICNVCNSLYICTRGIDCSETNHLNSSVHKQAVNPTKKRSKRFC